MNHEPRRAFPRAAALAAAVATSLFALPATASANHSLFEHVSDGAELAGSGAFDATFHRASADGSRVFFTTSERLTGIDTDASTDVYERTQGQTRLVSGEALNGGAALNAVFMGASADGSRVFFQTAERLDDADTDSSVDVYERSSGDIRLVSAGAINGNGAPLALFAGASSDGSRVFFTTPERLVAADSDGRTDIYERSGGVTSLVSAGAINGNSEFDDAFFRGASADGTRVFFETEEELVASDTDPAQDVYERSGGVTRLLSAGAVNGNGDFNASFGGASATGTRVFFQTRERLAGADTDDFFDVYERSNGTTKRVSAGAINGNGASAAGFEGVSANGSRVFFITTEQLVSTDTDASTDIYERSGGTTKQISTGNGAFNASFEGASADGTRVLFETNEQLVGADLDPGRRDVYARSGGTTTLISGSADGAFDAEFRGASADGSRVFFVTNERAIARDRDDRRDLYEHITATGLPTGIAKVSPGNGALDADFAGASNSGSAVFFTTREKVMSSDEDAALDVYRAFALQ